MEKSKVYYSDLRARPGLSLLDKLEKLMKKAGIENIDFKEKFVAIRFILANQGIYLFYVLIMLKLLLMLLKN